MKIFNKLKYILLLFMALFICTFANSQLSIGSNLPEISLKNNADSLVNLTSYKGKILLVDFWASWCAPCRKANKKLASLHRKYGSSNLVIVGISVDKDRSKWLKAIAKDKIDYVQLTDPYGFDGKTAIEFGVEALPASYLFDQNGILLAINPTEKEIKKTIKSFQTIKQ